MAIGGDTNQETTGMLSMHELLHQIESNKKHFKRSTKRAHNMPKRIASRSPLAHSVPTDLPPVRELDNDPDTFMFLCLPFPVITLQGLRRATWSCINNFLRPRPPLPCVMTTCGPIHHVRSCEFHPLAGAASFTRSPELQVSSARGAMPHRKLAMRSSISLLSVEVQRLESLPDGLCSSPSLPGPSASTFS